MSPLEGCEIISFRKMCGNTVLAWKQPRLNPIENLREILKNEVAEKQPLSARALNHAIKELWNFKRLL